MIVLLGFYMQDKEKSDSYELFDSTNIDTSEYDYLGRSFNNIDEVRLLIISHLKNSNEDYLIRENEYKISIYTKSDMSIINVYFPYDIIIRRDMKINQILDKNF